MTADQITPRADSAYARIARKSPALIEPAARQRAIARDDLPWTLTERERWDAVQALEEMVHRLDVEAVATAAHSVKSAVHSLMGPLPSLDPDARRRVDAALLALCEVDTVLQAVEGDL